MENVNGVTKTFGKVSIHSMKASEYSDKVAVTVVQTLVTTYPSGSNTGGSNAGLEAFGLSSASEGKSYEKKRYALVMFPATVMIDGKEIDVLENQSLIEKAVENGHIQMRESNDIEDILTENHLYAIEQGWKTLEDYQNRLAVQTAEGELIPDADDQPVYRIYGLQGAHVEDESSVTWTEEEATVEANSDIIE